MQAIQKSEQSFHKTKKKANQESAKKTTKHPQGKVVETGTIQAMHREPALGGNHDQDHPAQDTKDHKAHETEDFQNTEPGLEAEADTKTVTQAVATDPTDQTRTQEERAMKEKEPEAETGSRPGIEHQLEKKPLNNDYLRGTAKSLRKKQTDFWIQYAKQHQC